MSIAANIERVHKAIAGACARAGRSAGDVRLMGVSKFFPRAAVDEARRAGLTLFGESRVQEADAKFAVRPPSAGIELHLIGALQRNKAKKAAALFDSIDSVDRDELINTLGVLTAAREKPLMILLELNAGEEQKSGYRSADALLAAAERTARYPGLCLRGLMTLAPLSSDVDAVRQAFRRLARAQARLKTAFPQMDCSELSMGMSGDFEIAIEEGATLVRIGTAIFGGRE